MIALQLMVALLTATIAVSAVAKLADDFVRFRWYVAENSTEGLISLLQENRQWTGRHLLCAIAGLALIVYCKHSPALEMFDMLAQLSAVHVTLSLFFVLIESLFAQKLSQELSSRLEPVTIRQRDRNRRQ